MSRACEKGSTTKSASRTADSRAHWDDIRPVTGLVDSEVAERVAKIVACAEQRMLDSQSSAETPIFGSEVSMGKILFRLIQRPGTPYSFKGTVFKKLEDAVRAARESNEDYLIEEISDTGVSLKVVNYRLGEFEMG